MTSTKPGDLHPYDPEVDRTFHRLSRNNRSVVLHDSVVLDTRIMHTDFIIDFVFSLVLLFLSVKLVLIQWLITTKLLRNWLHLMLCINLDVFNILRQRLVMSLSLD